MGRLRTRTLFFSFCFIAGGLAVACRQGLVEAPQVPVTSSAPPKVQSATALQSAPAARSDRVLDLRQFRPLLAQPELLEVAFLHQNGDDAAAAELLAQRMKGTRASDPRFQYLLGRLWETAGRTELAYDAYHRAVEHGVGQAWSLVDEARLNCARLSLALNEPERALTELGSVAVESPVSIELKARAFDRSERLVEAEAQWSRLIARLPTVGPTVHRAYLGHAESLWALGQGRDAGDFKERAAQALARAELGLKKSDPVSLRVEELRRSWQVQPVVDAPDLLLMGVEELVRSNDFEQADLVLQKVQLSPAQQAGPLGCQSRYLRGKILAGQRKWGQAADAVIPGLNQCTTDAEFHASLLFNAGKYAAADGRDSAAVRFYEELEAKYSASSLADDARLRRAQSYRDMGAQARFVELLASMPEDYPDGDMSLEGILTLALDQMISHKWSEAASVLERAAAVVRNHDSARGHEYAGTERYFLARCLMELGEEQRALDEYEELIVQVPLSYYMLHAYSRLLEADKERARTTLAEAAAQALQTPFEFPYRPEYDSPEFRRAMELLTVGEFALGKEALSALSSGDGADDSLLWGIALLYDQALDAHHGHQLARGQLTDWLAHYPQGDWQRPWEIGFPRPYLASVERESKASGVPAWLIYGVMREESTFVPDIVSPANAYGLMQIIEPTARGIGQKFNLPYSTLALKRPASNIAIGSRVLAELAKRFKKNPLLAIPGYNAGPGRPGRWLSERPHIDFDLWVETIPIRETRRYTKRVLASRAAYAFLYYPDSADTALVLPKRLNLN